MKYIVNILLFLIMIYSLTVMPIDMKALQVDVSWEKYKAIEEKKENEKQEAVISETVKSSQYSINYSGDSYLFNPSELKLQLSGDEKLGDLQSDVLSKLTFEWVNEQSGDAQILTVPQEALTVGQTLGTNVDFSISLASLTQLMDGQYQLKIKSRSELTADAPEVTVNVSWFKQSAYKTLFDDFGSLTPVTYYYPTTGGRVLPITEGVAKDKTLRRMANHLLSGPGNIPGFKTGQSTPRIRNIKHSNGKLSLYMNTSDVDAAKKAGLTEAQMTEILSKTYFSLPYIKEINLYVANKPVTPQWAATDVPSPIFRPAETKEFFNLTTVGGRVLFVSGAKTFTTVQEVLTAMSTPDTANGKLCYSPVPDNVTLSAVSDPSNLKAVTVNISISGKLYGDDPKLTQMLLDAVALNLSRSGLIDEVRFTVNDQPVEALNGIKLSDAYPIPEFINAKTAE